jgi:hypothetical protein
VPAKGRAQIVTDAWVAATRTLGERPNAGGRRFGRALITVACALSTGRTRYLAVTVERDRSGGLAVVDYPGFVPPPPAAHLGDRATPDPVTGANANAVTSLLEQFFPVYLAGKAVAAQFLMPGATLAPLAQAFDGVSVVSVADGGSQTGGEHLVLTLLRARDLATRAQYTLRYRVAIKRTTDGRWLVNSIQGDPR